MEPSFEAALAARQDEGVRWEIASRRFMSCTVDLPKRTCLERTELLITTGSEPRPVEPDPERLSTGGGYSAAAPTESAIRARRDPSGCGSPTVVSSAVWCSVSAFSCAPIRTIIVEIQIQVMNPMAAPSEP